MNFSIPHTFRLVQYSHEGKKGKTFNFFNFFLDHAIIYIGMSMDQIESV